MPSTHAGTPKVFVFKLPPVQATAKFRDDHLEEEENDITCTVLASVNPFPVGRVYFRAWEIGDYRSGVYPGGRVVANLSVVSHWSN